MNRDRIRSATERNTAGGSSVGARASKVERGNAELQLANAIKLL